MFQNYLVGDQDSVIVIPAHLVDGLAEEAQEMTAYEDFVAVQVRKGVSIIGLYPAPKMNIERLLPPGERKKNR